VFHSIGVALKICGSDRRGIRPLSQHYCTQVQIWWFGRSFNFA